MSKSDASRGKRNVPIIVIYTNEYDNDNHLIKSKGEIISYTYY